MKNHAINCLINIINLTDVELSEEEQETAIAVIEATLKGVVKDCCTNWINVSKALPSEEQEVIVYFVNKSGLHVGCAYWNGRYFIDSCEECGNEVPYTSVIYWQPLPKAPVNL